MPFGDRYWLFWALYVVVPVVAAGVGAWVGSFLKKEQNFATKQDYDELQKQLKANTELVGIIKSQFSQREWARREWTNLRRLKLEALLEKMNECEADLERYLSAALRGSRPENERDYIGELGAISTLYFPELRKLTHDFIEECREEYIGILKLAEAVRKAGDDHAAIQSAYGAFDQSHWPPERRLQARNAIRDAARPLLERIMNV